MADIIPRGFDAATGQNKSLGSGDTLVDQTGTPVSGPQGGTGLQGATGIGAGGGTLSGAMRVIRFAFDTSATTDSTFSIPTASYIQLCSIKITTPFDDGTTIQVGRAGFAATFMTIDQNNPQAEGTYTVLTPDAITIGVVRVTVSGSPAAGAGICTAWYAEVDT